MAESKKGALTPGARVEIRDEEWMVRTVKGSTFGGRAVCVVGVSELVRGKEAIFLSELDQIREQRQKEQLVFDQIFSSYNRIKQNITASQYDEALENLNTLNNYLNQESIASLPAIQRRRSVEIFIITSLRRLI